MLNGLIPCIKRVPDGFIAGLTNNVKMLFPQLLLLGIPIGLHLGWSSQASCWCAA